MSIMIITNCHFCFRESKEVLLADFEKSEEDYSSGGQKGKPGYRRVPRSESESLKLERQKTLQKSNSCKNYFSKYQTFDSGSHTRTRRRSRSLSAWSLSLFRNIRLRPWIVRFLVERRGAKCQIFFRLTHSDRKAECSLNYVFTKHGSGGTFEVEHIKTVASEILGPATWWPSSQW